MASGQKRPGPFWERSKNGKSRQNKLLPRHSRNNTRKRNMLKKQLWKCNSKK